MNIFCQLFCCQTLSFLCPLTGSKYLHEQRERLLACPSLKACRSAFTRRCSERWRDRLTPGAPCCVTTHNAVRNPSDWPCRGPLHNHLAEQTVLGENSQLFLSPDWMLEDPCWRSASELKQGSERFPFHATINTFCNVLSCIYRNKMDTLQDLSFRSSSRVSVAVVQLVGSRFDSLSSCPCPKLTNILSPL